MVDDLRNELAGDRFKRGDTFYSLQALSQRYDVSLITAKRAYAELEQEGWVKRHRGKGTIILKQGKALDIKLFLPEEVPLDSVGKFIMLEIYTGISEAVRETGCKLIKFSNPGIFLSGKEKNNAFIIIQDYDQFDADESLAVLKNGLNATVVVHAYAPKENCSSVVCDFRKGGYLATKHLLSLGHRRIALLGSKISNPWMSGRFEGYVEALKSEGIRLDWSMVKETNAGEEEDREALEELFINRRPPTAVFAAADLRAFHTLEFCRHRGIRVPDDLSLIGFDNLPESALTDPPLTTMDTHLKQMGSEAVHLVLDLVNGKRTNENRMLTPTLVVRESTAPPRRGTAEPGPSLVGTSTT